MGTPAGLWTSVSGAMAQSQNVDTIANNIANVNTTGFKKDTPTFKEYLTSYEKTNDPVVDIPRTAFKDSEFYHTQGKENAMVNVDKIVADHAQGSFKETRSPFDVAIEGNGFFTIRTPNGIKFTRAGDFKINSSGKLVTNEGLPVLMMGAGGEETPAQQGQATEATRNPASTNPFTKMEEYIRLKPDPNDPNAPKPSLEEINLADLINQGQKIKISDTGEIFAGEELVGKLAIAEFSDSKLLQKLNASTFVNPDKTNVPKVAENFRAMQGYLEMSNVNSVSELMNLLKANRMYESNMRAIRAYSEMSAKETNEVGKL